MPSRQSPVVYVIEPSVQKEYWNAHYAKGVPPPPYSPKEECTIYSYREKIFQKKTFPDSSVRQLHESRTENMRSTITVVILFLVLLMVLYVIYFARTGLHGSRI